MNTYLWGKPNVLAIFSLFHIVHIHRDLGHDHGYSDHKPKVFPLIALCHHAYTIYRAHSLIGQTFSDHN